MLHGSMCFWSEEKETSAREKFLRVAKGIEHHIEILVKTLRLLTVDASPAPAPERLESERGMREQAMMARVVGMRLLKVHGLARSGGAAALVAAASARCLRSNGVLGAASGVLGRSQPPRSKSHARNRKRELYRSAQ